MTSDSRLADRKAIERALRDTRVCYRLTTQMQSQEVRLFVTLTGLQQVVTLDPNGRPTQ